MKRVFSLLFILWALLTCSGGNDLDPILIEEDLYFPPNNTSEWHSISPAELQWDQDQLSELYTYLEDNNTRAFIILKEGKIVVEEYWGQNIVNTGSFNSESIWYWASASKCLTATLVGIAQEEGELNIDERTSDYLGEGWTSLPKEKEELITIQHQLTMSTGLDYTVSDLDCTTPECLEYRADAGIQWYYHNAPYTLLKDVVANATTSDYNTYTDTKVGSIIGMSGQWRQNGYNSTYWSSARDMARFGLLMLNNGTWNTTPVLSDQEYFSEMVNSSQDLNLSYGYLWWLNGKGQIRVPSIARSFNTDLAPNAPKDLIAALGKNGQFIDVIPSQKLVLIRVGEAPGDSLVPIQFHDDIWMLLSTAIPNL